MEGTTPPTDVTTAAEAPTPGGGRPIRLIVWGVLSLGFLAFLAFGRVNARFWKFDEFQLQQEFAIESKSIARIWQIQGENLPQVSHQWLMQVAYYGAIVVFVACVIVGMRLLLAETRESPESIPGEHP